jgi:hypothetical protein
MNELAEFIDAADETSAQWIGLIRTEHENPTDAQVGVMVGVDEDWENRGPVLIAVASGGNDRGHVAVSIHAFVDGVRVEPNVLVLGDEFIVTLQNS